MSANDMKKKLLPQENRGGKSYSEMSLLEWFAGMALQGLLANSPGVPLDVHDEAIVAFEYAEAMLIEAEKRKCG